MPKLLVSLDLRVHVSSSTWLFNKWSFTNPFMSTAFFNLMASQNKKTNMDFIILRWSVLSSNVPKLEKKSRFRNGHDQCVQTQLAWLDFLFRKQQRRQREGKPLSVICKSAKIKFHPNNKSCLQDQSEMLEFLYNSSFFHRNQQFP